MRYFFSLMLLLRLQVLEAQFSIAAPVSYTHLDVYKRQIVDGVTTNLNIIAKTIPPLLMDIWSSLPSSRITETVIILLPG